MSMNPNVRIEWLTACTGLSTGKADEGLYNYLYSDFMGAAVQ